MWLVFVALACLVMPSAAPGQAIGGKVGQRVMDERVEFTVRRVEWHKALKAGSLTAAPQGEFLALYVRAENGANVGSRSVTPETVILMDGQGRRLARSAQAERVLVALRPEEALLFEKGREIYPSLHVDGWVVFDVPKDATALKLVVKGVPSSRGTAIELPGR